MDLGLMKQRLRDYHYSLKLNWPKLIMNFLETTLIVLLLIPTVVIIFLFFFMVDLLYTKSVFLMGYLKQELKRDYHGTKL